MATNFPTSLDSFTTKVDNVDSVLAAHINGVQDSVVSIQTKVGVNSSATTSSLDYKIRNLPTQDSTSKVTNLNADLLNSQSASYYTNVSNMASGTLAIIRGGTGTTSISAANRVLLSTDGSTFTTGQVDLSTSQIKNNLPVTNLNSGTGASSSTYWRGDGTWAALSDTNTSNVLFQYSAQTTNGSATKGSISNTNSFNPTTGAGYSFIMYKTGADTSFHAVWGTKWKKVAGINTITIYAEIWTFYAGSSATSLKVDVGGQNNSVVGTTNQLTPEWVTFTIDISGLSNGTVYAVTASLSTSENSANDIAYMGNLIAFGS